MQSQFFPATGFKIIVFYMVPGVCPLLASLANSRLAAHAEIAGRYVE